MTEETGWAQELPAEPAPEPPPAVSEPAEVMTAPPLGAEPFFPPAGGPGVQMAGPPQPAEPAPDHVPPPFVPETGVAGWLREALHELHRRLRALGG